jgi:hypothetical protein
VTNDGRLLLSGGSDVITTDTGVRFQASIGGWDTIVTVLGPTYAAMSGGWDLSLVAMGANGHAFQGQTIEWAGRLTTEPSPVKSGIRATRSFAGAFCVPTLPTESTRRFTKSSANAEGFLKTSWRECL